MLQQTADLCEKTDPLTAIAIRKDCDDVRLSTINSLLQERKKTKLSIAEIRSEVELNKEQKEDLSKGSIDQEELAKIKNEFDELEATEKEKREKNQSIEKLDTLLTEKWLDTKYSAVLDLSYWENISSSFVEVLIREIDGTGKVSLKTLEELKDFTLWNIEVSEIQLADITTRIEKWFEDWDLGSIWDEIRWELWIGPEAEVIIIKALDTYLLKNPEKNSVFLSEYSKDFFGMCMPEKSLYMEILYLRVQDTVTKNINTFLKNSEVGAEKIESLQEKVAELIEKMKENGCSMEYFSIIQEFLDTHLDDYHIDIDSKEALGIIWTVIKLKKTETELKIMAIRDKITNISKEGYEEVWKVLKNWNIDEMRTYLSDEALFPDQEEAQALLEEIEDVLWARKKIETQEETVEKLSEMDQEWLNTIVRLSKILWRKIDTAEAETLSYILENPQDRLQEIQNPKQLVEIFQTYSLENHENLNQNEKWTHLALSWVKISSLSPNILTPKLIENFPWEFDDFWSLDWILRSNPSLIQHVILHSRSNQVISHMCNIWDIESCYIALNTLSSYDSPSRYFWEGGLNISSSILWDLPLSLRKYINKQTDSNIQLSEKEWNTEVISEEGFQNLVSKLEQKTGERLNLQDKREFKALSVFLEEHWVSGYKNESQRIIKAGFWNIFNNLKFDRESIDIATLLLKDDPTRIHDIPVSLRWHKEVVNILIDHWEAYFDYIEVKSIDSALQVIETLRNAWLPISGKIRSQLNTLFDTISDAEKREFIHNEEKRVLLKWVLDSMEKYDLGIENAGVISRKLKTNEVHSESIIGYLEKEWLNKNGEWSEFVQELLSGWGRLSYENAYAVLESQNLSPEIIWEHLRNILKITEQKLTAEIKELESTKLIWDSKSIWEISSINNKGDTILDITKAEASFKKFIESQERPFTSESEALQAYIEFHKIEWNDKVVLTKLLTKNAELEWVRASLNKSNIELAHLAKEWKLDDYIIAHRISYFNWENPEDVFQEIQKVRQQEWDAKSLWDEHHTNKDISAILDTWVFTPGEISDLTPEEVSILTWDSEEARENLINMHETLQELNLEFLWKHRHQYLIAMWDGTIENDQEWSIDKSELLKILNFTMKVLWEKSDYSNINWVKDALKTVNDAHNNPNKSNLLWRSDVEQLFWEKWYLDENRGINISNLRDTSKYNPIK